MNKKNSKIVCIITIVLICVLTILFLCFPKKLYSEQENRYLESFPSFSSESLWDASLMQDLETYASDHFPFRDLFMTIRTWQQRIMGKNEINGIYLCKDGYFIEEYHQPQNTQRIISAFQKLEQKVENADVSFLLAPTAVTVYADKLPLTAVNASQTEEIQRIYDNLSSLTISITDRLLENKDQYQLFYRLDHHWTTYGAYLAYQRYCEEKGLTALGMEQFTPKVVSDQFQGTIYSKLNDLLAGKDEITIFEQDQLFLKVLYTDSGEETNSVYAEEYLRAKDKYSYFLNNIHPMIEITNTQAGTQDELVLIKDSYANCIVPFLANHYAKIYVVDTRYYKQSITQFINEHTEVTDVLVLYNMNTIDSDLGIGGIY